MISPEDEKSVTLSQALKNFYQNKTNLLPNILDGRLLPVMDVQLSLVENLRGESKEKGKEEKGGEEKEGDKFRKGTSSAIEKRLLEEEESTLAYYESWHNVSESTLLPADIFDVQGNSKAPRRILVLGPAGVGKTTLSHLIAHRWGKDKLWREKFEYLYWLPLRCLTNYLEKLKAFADEGKYYEAFAHVLYQECLSVEAQAAHSAAAIAETLKHQGEVVLLVMDGWDEIAPHVEKNPFLFKLLQAMMKLGHVVMTSRPYQLQGLPLEVKDFDRRLENRGFNRRQIGNYVRYYFETLTPSKLKAGEDLLGWLDRQPRLMGMAHIPVNLSLLCGIWDKEGSLNELEEKPPGTDFFLSMTVLYQKVTDHLGSVPKVSAI